ncbi:MAG: hypothetical protein AAGF60_08650 [Pseudomonadota bacterium]
MKNVIATVFAAALIAGPAFAQSLPTNNTVSGGQGDAQLDGQIAVGATLAGLGTVTAVAVVAGVLLITVVNDDGEESTVTTTTSP